VAHRSGKSEPRVNMRYGGTSSQLVRWAAELADAWRYEIGNLVPCVPIDLTSETPTITVGRLEIRQYFNWTGNSEDAQPEPEPEPEPNDDTTPTTTTIDDVLSQHDGDESEAQQ
jgi:hypothetical protein